MEKMSQETKKILIIAVVAIVLLNYLVKDSNKGNAPAAPQPQAAAPQPQAPPSEEEQLKQALADKVNVDLGNTPVLGSKDAPIKLIVFSDFQCPFSKRGADTTRALIEKYGKDKVMYVYKNLPLPFHPEAMPSAKAALAAGKQGKYYEFHDKLFEHQGELSEALYVKTAKELGLNMDKFNSDRNSKEIEDQVKADAAQANSLGFSGTPGFALNGVKILGAYPQDHFEKIIKALGVG